MWSTFIENREILKGVYKDTEPSFKCLCIRDFSILPGEDIRVIVKFDTDELPLNMPKKWQAIGVNRVQFIIEFIGVNLSVININCENYQNVELSLHSIENNNHIVCLDVSRNKVFALEAKWIYLKNITGYQDTKAT